MRAIRFFSLLVLLLAFGAAKPGWTAAKAEPGAQKAPVEGQERVSTPEQRRDYEKKMTQELEAVKDRLATLKMKVMRGPGQQRRTGLRWTQSLEAQTLNAGYQLEQLKQNRSDWDRARMDLDKTMAELQRNLAAAEQQIR